MQLVIELALLAFAIYMLVSAFFFEPEKNRKMTREQKIELAREMRTNMVLTKEQYLEMCRLVDELDLNRPEAEPEEPSWDDIIQQVEGI